MVRFYFICRSSFHRTECLQVEIEDTLQLGYLKLIVTDEMVASLVTETNLSPGLYNHLKENSTLDCGTMRQNRKNGPPKDMTLSKVEEGRQDSHHTDRREPQLHPFHGLEGSARPNDSPWC
ncbi:hypothetical protein ElyMa_000051600 [Elysia marginata]|uniref:Uncharacterized protein n=1 Tax=Elysia marginata TaxID=1093978 RepID=A0AAV4EE03_9GAST|nr:hypothetical protein ElyMa_000051600 [Elysia marginata]